MYSRYLIDIGKLVYIISNSHDASSIKKILEASESKSKVFFKCMEQLPSNMYSENQSISSQGILRKNWLDKIIDKSPEMIAMFFTFTFEELDQNQKYQTILKRCNKVFYILRTHNKQDVILKIIVVLPKYSTNYAEKVLSYLKNYEKDLYVLHQENYVRQISKYRNSWISMLDKNYERLIRDSRKKLQEIYSQHRIAIYFKIAAFGELLPKQNLKELYSQLYASIKAKFTQILSKDKNFTFHKFFEIRQLRTLADISILRYIKYKITSNTIEIPDIITSHLTYFKMKSMQPGSCHVYYYLEELQWRTNFLQNLLELLYSHDVIQILPLGVVAELLNGLITYIHKLATISAQILLQIEGKLLPQYEEQFVGRINYNISESSSQLDVYYTNITQKLKQKKDYTSKAIQILSRFKSSNIFKQNQLNFINIYLSRFFLIDGKFNSIVGTFNEMVKYQINRCNYYLVNQFIKQVSKQIQNVDQRCKSLLYGVASLVCDYFEEDNQLQEYLSLFLAQLRLSLQKKQPEESKSSLFDDNLDEEDNNCFKLKKASRIFNVEVGISDHLIFAETPLKLTIKLILNKNLHQLLRQYETSLQLKFNHKMVWKQILKFTPEELNDDQPIVREILIEPLQYIMKDCCIELEEASLFMCNNSLVWLLQKKQITFSKYHNCLFYCQLVEPTINIKKFRLTYYLNEVSSFYVHVNSALDCKVTANFIVKEQDEGKTEIYKQLQQKNNLTNLKASKQLEVNQGNELWIKSNKKGQKKLKFLITMMVQKSVKVGWREKELILKSQFSIPKEVNFVVKRLFGIGKIFRDATSGFIYPKDLPIGKKLILISTLKSAEKIKIKQLYHKTNPQKIKYYRTSTIEDTELNPSDQLKNNIIFELNEDCSQQIELFLSTLHIKWQRIDEKGDNLFVDYDTKINTVIEKAQISFEQHNTIETRKKSFLYVKIENLVGAKIKIIASMESTDDLVRIGHKQKLLELGANQKTTISFEILCVHAGVYDFPPVRVYVDGVDAKITSNGFLVSCL